MNDFSVMWAVLAGVATLLVLVTRSLHMLVLAIAFALAWLLAKMGAMLPLQVSAVLCLAGMGITWLSRASRLRRQHEGLSPDADDFSVLDDLGRELHIYAWEEGNQTKVLYQGDMRLARLAPGRIARHGVHRVRGERDGVLILEYLHP